MNIKSTSAYGVYTANWNRPSESEPFHSAAGAPAGAKGENTDQILISRTGARQSEIERISRSIVSEIERPAAPERLESLRAAVENKTYYVPTEDLVDALAERWFGI